MYCGVISIQQKHEEIQNNNHVICSKYRIYSTFTCRFVLGFLFDLHWHCSEFLYRICSIILLSFGHSDIYYTLLFYRLNNYVVNVVNSPFCGDSAFVCVVASEFLSLQWWQSIARSNVKIKFYERKSKLSIQSTNEHRWIQSTGHNPNKEKRALHV